MDSIFLPQGWRVDKWRLLCVMAGRIMATYRVREEVLNVILAELLSDRGLLSVPETIRTSLRAPRRRLPDVTIGSLHGVRIVIEGRIATNATVPDTLLADASARVREGISPICLAVLYPRQLRAAESLSRLRRAMERAVLTVRVISEGDDGDWVETTVDGLTDVLRRSYELLVTEDVVLRAVEELDEAIEVAGETLASAPAAGARLRALLGIPEETNAGTPPDEEG